MMWFLILVIVQALDVWTTRLGLAAGFTEGNPIMVNVVNDLPKLIGVKVAAAIIMVTLIEVGLREDSKFRRLAWLAAICVSAAPVINNTVRMWT